MNVRKRPRLELAAAATATDVALMGSTAYANGNGIANGHATSLASIGSMVSTGGTTANGLFLTSSLGVAGMEINNGAQIYLTICGDDDNSTESQEFYAIESIKQEPDLDALHHALLPTNLQLPTGCEIYLVKDTTGAAVGAGAASTTAASTVGSPKTINDQLLQKHTHTQSMASIKLEPDSISTPSTTNVLFVSGNTPTHNILVAAGKETNAVAAANAGAAPAPAAAAAVAATAPHCTGYNVKLDAYKKRDDKRRATHNEVERRRRDKINCWIFKLKEMLPTDGNRYKSTNNLESMESSCNSSKATTLTLTTTTLSSSSSSLATATPSSISSSSSLSSTGAAAAGAGAVGVTTTTTTAATNSKSNQNNGRTPPNDSKSQILIKACDYIKSMQNEIDSLRACLREAESLRLSNQQLREELDILKQQQELRFNTAGGSFNVTLNSLNSSATSDLFDVIDTAPNLSTVSSINFTKRGLMIADYDD